jgi:hypothetical protein
VHSPLSIAGAFAATLALSVCAVLRGEQPSAEIGLSEAMRVPGEERIAAACEQAWKTGWTSLAPSFSDAAILAYEQGYLESARAWLNLARWARLLGEPEAEFVPAWQASLRSERLYHANMPAKYPLRPHASLSSYMGRDSQRVLASESAFLDEFFSQVTPYDYLPSVLGILDVLRTCSPENFADYPSLALAIALVYDVPPPPDWPHGQVPATLLPRKLPAPLETFAFLAEQDRTRKSFLRLRKLGAEELKFAVDMAANFDDLRWSTKVVDVPLDRFDKVYGLIRYRIDRVRNNNPSWNSGNYSLPRILAEGGICVDQAYFACQVGKARGVPTLLFRGAGLDGRHAWFGYLDGHGAWQLDAGRYAEQRFVTGVAINPQTWAPLTDHALRFLAERFQSQNSARRSQVHESFAREYLGRRMPEKAKDAARAAIRAEPRNLAAYRSMDLILRTLAAPVRDRETIWREAIIAFQRYPDLEQQFTSALVESLRKRGEKSMADFEEKKLIRKYQGERVDLSIQQSAQLLSRSFSQDALPVQINVYNHVLEQYGKGAGMAFFDGIVVVFAEHLLQLGQPVEALKALDRAKRTLRVEAGSQLESEFERIAKKIRRG